MPSSPTVDTSGGATASGASSISFSVVTSGNDEVIALVIANADTAGGSRTVSSISGASFAKQGATISQGALSTQFQGNEAIKIEIWTAPIAVAATTSITVNFSGSCVGIGVVYLAVAGTYSGSAYLDSNAGFPYSAFDNTTVPLLTYTTNQADDLLWHNVISGRLGTYGSAPAGWGAGPNLLENVTNCTVQNVSYTKSVSSVQVGAVTGVPSSSPFPAISVLLGFTADAAGLVLQTFVTTICT